MTQAASAEEVRTPGSPEKLTVIKAGNGSGTVTSDPAGIDCGPDCQEFYSKNERVILTAAADPGSVFVGWDPGGGPGCPGTGTCELKMASDKTVTATFRKLEKFELAVTRSGTGTGTVLSDVPGIDCGSDCSEVYDENTIVTLSTDADPDSTFEGWTGAGCSGQDLCVVTMDEAKTVDAEFSLKPKFTLDVTRSGSGTGTVTSAPPGIDCGSECSEEYLSGTMVTLSAATDTGSTFEGWTGAGCTGTGSCEVTMDEAKTVDAEFAEEPAILDTLEVTKSGDGEGAVTSDPVGIECGSDCSEQFERGSTVTLTATAESGSEFTGWTGAGCSGTGTCVLTLSEASTVDAQFTKLPPAGYELTVSKSGDGSGSVTSSPSGIDCGSDCSEEFTEGTAVTLTAEPDTGSSFEGWIGAGCSGTDPCLVTMTEARQVEASFSLDPGPETYQLNVVKAGNGEGRVTASPGDIDCGPICSGEFLADTMVTLTATAENGDVFVKWQGPCEDGNPCVVTLDESKTVTAVFDDPPPAEHLVSVAKNGGGDGLVQSDPNGIRCGEECARIYTDGTGLTLEAAPDYSSTFEAWNGGACDQTVGRTCRIEVDGPKAVDAIFAPKPGGGVWARKRKQGLNTVADPSRQRLMNAVNGICLLGNCQIRTVDARVVIRRQKFGSIPATWSGAVFAAGQKRSVRVRFPGRLWRKLGTRKTGTLVVSIGLTAADGRRAVTREIKIGIRR